MITFSIEGQLVQRLCLDYGVSIEASDGAVLRIETSFQLSLSNGGQIERVDPGRLEQTGAPLFSLLNQEIGSVSFGEDGLLTIRFVGGQLLLCEPNETFEAWSILAPSGEQIVCLPGGGVSVWPEVQGS